MTRDVSDLDVEKNRVVHDLFIDTADDNYVLSRWCYAGGLNIDYAWMAVNALEKYLKAALLLNGRSALRYGHDITKLYTGVREFAAGMFPGILDKPTQIDLPYWHDETPEKYLERLLGYGNAHNRYMIFGYILHMEDLFKLDRMVFAVRRLCGQLDTYLLGRRQREDIEERGHAGDPHVTCRDILLRQPEYWDWIGSNLSSVIAGDAVRKCGTLF